MVLGVSGLVAALIAAWYVGKDGMAVSMYTVIVVLFAMILGPVIEVCNTARNFGLIFAAADRIYRVLEAKPLVQDSGNRINTKDLTPEICFENVSFRYREDLEAAVENISFRIQPGEHIAVAEGHPVQEKQLVSNCCFETGILKKDVSVLEEKIYETYL